MFKKFNFSFVLIVLVVHSNAQILSNFKQILKSDKKYYFSYGYHRAIFSKSDLHFRNNSNNQNKDASGNYDFILYDAKASDRPDFDKIKDIRNFTVPQFNATMGFKSKFKNLGFEINYNHAKYVVNRHQKLRIKGNLFNEYVDSTIELNPSFFHVEHTDGANFWMINLVKTFPISKPNKFIRFELMSKIGGGMVIPKTNITFFGVQTDNKFHIAGYVYAIENGLQVSIGKHLFIETTNKLAFAYYTNAKVSSDKNAYLTHHFKTAMFFTNIGITF